MPLRLTDLWGISPPSGVDFTGCTGLGVVVLDELPLLRLIYPLRSACRPWERKQRGSSAQPRILHVIHEALTMSRQHAVTAHAAQHLMELHLCGQCRWHTVECAPIRAGWCLLHALCQCQWWGCSTNPSQDGASGKSLGVIKIWHEICWLRCTGRCTQKGLTPAKQRPPHAAMPNVYHASTCAQGAHCPTQKAPAHICGQDVKLPPAPLYIVLPPRALHPNPPSMGAGALLWSHKIKES